MNERTLNYYNKCAELFNADTACVDFLDVQNRFLSFLDEGSFILDFGCGSGRDTKYFISKKFKVDATDGSKELCKLAAKNTGITVKNEKFSELNAVNIYDGIWACASILHLTKTELTLVLEKIITALKNRGYFYTSFKNGVFEGYRGDRYYTDFTEESFREYILQFPELNIIDVWTSDDVRPGRSSEQWLNIIMQKA